MESTKENGDRRPLITVIGITGYIGSHIGQILLKSGRYRVRGTTRARNKSDKLQCLRDAYGLREYATIEIVEANLKDQKSINAAIQGSHFVIYVASPIDVHDPDCGHKFVPIAFDGTTYVLNACREHKVKRLCMTSSLAAVTGVDVYDQPDDNLYSELNWSDYQRDKGISEYAKSKLFAEKLAWHEVEKHSMRGSDLELTVINPGLVVGPSLVSRESQSSKIIKNLMNGEYETLQRVSFPTVDVRDVAQAHVNAIESDKAQGMRFCLSCETNWFIDLALILHEEFGDQGYSVSRVEANWCMLYLYSFVHQNAATMLENWGEEILVDNTRSRELLGIKYRPTNLSIIEMAQQMIEKGEIENFGDQKRKTS